MSYFKPAQEGDVLRLEAEVSLSKICNPYTARGEAYADTFSSLCFGRSST